jgi:hypothetical protein
MAIDLSATGPQFFTMNGFIFEKRVEDFNSIFIYHQGQCVGIVYTGIAESKIYFDNTMGYYMLGGFNITNWAETLNHAISVNPFIHANYVYQRGILQEVLNTKRAELTQQTLMDIQYTVNQDAVDDWNNNMDIEDETDEEDADNYEFFFGNHGMFGIHLPIEPLAQY